MYLSTFLDWLGFGEGTHGLRTPRQGCRPPFDPADL